MINITDLDGQAHSIDLDNLGNVALRMDCMELMRALPDKCFELSIVDPPYGIGAAKEKPHNGWKDYGIKLWDEIPPPKEYFDELKRVSVNQIIWGGNYFTNNLSPSMGWVFWDKMQREFSLADGELAWTSFDKALRAFNYSRAQALQDGKIHPTQKPIELYAWLLSKYAHKGDKILDTHLGSGSSRIAAWQAGYNFLGAEIDQDYFKAQEERYASYAAQYKLF